MVAGMSTEIGTILRTLRQAAKMTQTALAREVTSQGLTITQQAIDRIERGLRSLRAEEAVKLAAVLDVNAGDLLQVTPERLSALQKLLGARAAGRRLRAQAAELERQLGDLAIEIEHADALEREASTALESLAGIVTPEPPLPGF